MRFLLAMTLLLLGPACGNAAGEVPGTSVPKATERLEIGVSTSEIAIASDFDGADLTVFGTIPDADPLALSAGLYDVVVVLEGPKDYATLRRKERVLGIWVNRQAMTFEPAPKSYSIASTRRLEAIEESPSLDPFAVGIDRLALNPVGYIPDFGAIGEFRNAFRRLKISAGLYSHNPSGVRFVASNLFRASLRLPANIPNGTHMLRAFLFRGGVLIAQERLPLLVVKTGLEQAVSDAARQRPLAYGIACVLIAAFTGWGASLLFRKA